MASQDKFFSYNLEYLFFVGLWPKEHWTQNQLILYKIYEVTLHFLSFIFLAITGVGLYQHRHDTIHFLSNLDKSFVSYNFVLKVIVFVLKRKSVKDLINEIECFGDQMSEKRKKLMRTHVMFITILGSSVLTIFSLWAFYKGEISVEAWMPFDSKKNKMNLALGTQIIALTFTVPCLYRCLAMQGIVCSIIIYICDQLVELQGRLRALKYSPENEGDAREEFKEIVKKHIRMLRYSQSMRTLFKEFFFIQNIAVTVELCLNAVMVSVVGFNQKVLLANFLIFLMAALINAYIYCYLGNELIIQSEGIALAAYESSWTSWPLNMQNDLLTVIAVAQRPFRLSAGGMATMSVETFARALYNGYSIFAVLNDVVD